MTRLSIKQKILTAMTAHSKLLTFGMSLAVPAILSTVIGFIELQEVYALNSSAASAAAGENSAAAGGR
jgi:hypothetical protein